MYCVHIRYTYYRLHGLSLTVRAKYIEIKYETTGCFNYTPLHINDVTTDGLQQCENTAENVSR